MPDVWSNLDVVEIILGDAGRDTQASAIPGNLEIRIFLVYLFSQQAYGFWIGIAAHIRQACDIIAVALNKVVDSLGVEWHANIVPKIMAVASRAATRAIGNINCQCHFIGYLLKNDSCINGFEHCSF